MTTDPLHLMLLGRVVALVAVHFCVLRSSDALLLL